MKCAWWFLSPLLLASAALAGCGLVGSTSQTAGSDLAVTTVAGDVGELGSSDGVGTAALFRSPSSAVAVGSTLYVVDTGNGAVRALDLATHAVSTVAVGFTNPRGIATDGTSLYVADTYAHVIQRIDLVTPGVSVFAGASGTQGSADGVGGAARFSYPYGIACDGANLYVSDTYNETVRVIVISTQNVSTLAGTAGAIGSANGTGAAARFFFPYGLAVVGTDLYVADSSNYTLRRIVISTGAVTTVAGQLGTPGTTDAAGLAAAFDQPTGIATDGSKVYIADAYNHTIRQFDPGSTQVTTIAGLPRDPGSSDGDRYAPSGVYVHKPSQLNGPFGLAETGGVLYVTDTGNQTIRRIQ